MSLAPGATIGLFGGGQLGRMVAFAARAMGYDVVVLDPDARCAAAAVASRVIVGAFDDVDAAAELGRSCDVVSFEIERVSVAAAEAAARGAPVRPSPSLLHIVQDRARQKAWLRAHGFPLGDYWSVAGRDEARALMAQIGAPLRAKRTTDGYDGRGQTPLGSEHDVARLALLGDGPLVLERELTLTAELSVLVARNPSGALVVYPPAQNWHRDGILSHSVLPAADVPVELCVRAQALAVAIAQKLAVEGLLLVELFVVGDTLLVNEIAARPHNTYHTSELASATSQFEQLVRAVCDLPLGAATTRTPTALVNLLGDVALRAGAAPAYDAALALPGVTLRLYGKAPRAGRKVGHLLAVAQTSAEATTRALDAYARL